jgi:NAD-dependent deacetylase
LDKGVGTCGVFRRGWSLDRQRPCGLPQCKRRPLQPEAYPPERILSREFFDEHPAEFFDFYRTKLLNLKARPNIVHYTLAELERRGLLAAVITQNADGLHQMAGSRRVLDLHGNVYDNTCLNCGEKYDVTKVACCDGIPYCECGGVIKPGIVMFGEVPDMRVVMDCVREINACDLLIVGGTSLKVSSAGRLLKGFSGRMVIMNNEPTAMDDRADLIIRGESIVAFTELANMLKGEKQ